MVIDEIDRRIIQHLTEDARMSATDLARAVSMSASATTERIRRLRTSGLIRRFTIELDREVLGRSIDAFVDVRLRSDATKSEADGALADIDAVVDATHVTGRYDYQLALACRDVADLDAVLNEIIDRMGAEETNTRLLLRRLDGFPRDPTPD